jgi:hypothetical protein
MKAVAWSLSAVLCLAGGTAALGQDQRQDQVRINPTDPQSQAYLSKPAKRGD